MRLLLLFVVANLLTRVTISDNVRLGMEVTPLHKEYFMSFDLPESVKHLHGTLYLVPFSLIEIPEAEKDADNYQFTNPRLITESGQQDLMDQDLFNCLKEDIKEKTLMVPLICRYVSETKSVQLVGGDRRYRALSSLIEDKALVRDPSSVVMSEDNKMEYGFRSANYVYENVICQIYNVDNDLDALAYSYSENACRKNLSDGHDVALLMELRKYKASDDQILRILQKSKLWLRDTDNLVKKLDPASLNDLLEGRINRLAAIKLADIDDIGERNEIRETANQISEERNESKGNRDIRRLDRAIRKKEIAEVELQVAEQNDDDVEIEIAQTNLESANIKVSDAVTRQRETRNVTKGKDVDSAMKGSKVTSTEAKPIKSLKQSVIKENYIDYLTKVYKNDGVCTEETPQYTIPKQVSRKDLLMVAIRIAKGIHNGEENCVKILQKCFSPKTK